MFINIYDETCKPARINRWYDWKPAKMGVKPATKPARINPVISTEDGQNLQNLQDIYKKGFYRRIGNIQTL